MQPGVYAVVSPSGDTVVEQAGLSPRLDTLAGKTVGLLWNRVFRGDETLPIIGEQLAERHGDLTVLSWDEFPGTSVPDMRATRQRATLAALGETLRAKGVDAVVAGNAGCGACAAAAARLAITAERVGIPAVAVGSPNFLALTRQLARMEGLPDLKTAVYPGTLTIESAETLREKVVSVTVDEVEEALTRG